MERSSLVSVIVQFCGGIVLSFIYRAEAGRPGVSSFIVLAIVPTFIGEPGIGRCRLPTIAIVLYQTVCIAVIEGLSSLPGKAPKAITGRDGHRRRLPRTCIVLRVL